MKTRWTATVDNDASGTVIFEAPADEIAGKVAEVIREMATGVNVADVSMIAVIMRAEVQQERLG